MSEPNDPIHLIKHLEGPEPPATAPEWDVAPQGLRWRGPAVGVALAMAAGLLLWVAMPTQDTTRLRGGEGAVDIDLRIVVLTDAGPVRLSAGQTYEPGQSVVFRVGATPASTVSMWADGPGGRVELGTHNREPSAEDVTSGAGLLSLDLDRPGTWTVFASASGSTSCPPDSCAFRAIDVAESPE